jgi:hypothetical protein
MKKQACLLLSICMISEIMFSSAAFAEKDLQTDVAANITGISQEADKETETNQEKSEIKEVLAYLFGVAGSAAAIITCAYKMLFKSAPCDQQVEATPSPAQKKHTKVSPEKKKPAISLINHLKRPLHPNRLRAKSLNSPKTQTIPPTKHLKKLLPAKRLRVKSLDSPKS